MVLDLEVKKYLLKFNFLFWSVLTIAFLPNLSFSLILPWMTKCVPVAMRLKCQFMFCVITTLHVIFGPPFQRTYLILTSSGLSSMIGVNLIPNLLPLRAVSHGMLYSLLPFRRFGWVEIHLYLQGNSILIIFYNRMLYLMPQSFSSLAPFWQGTHPRIPSNSLGGARLLSLM